MIENKSPKSFEKILRASVIGQDEGIRTVAIAISSHLIRINHNRNHPSNPIQKDNLLILGPTGSGKTESFRTVVRAFNLPVPMAIVSTGTLTADGYKGKNVSSILDELIKDALRIINKDPSLYLGNMDNDEERKKRVEKAVVKLANNGIVILDEFDKIRIDPLKDDHDNFFPQTAQRQLLKMIEGATGIGEERPGNLIDTTNILFVATGAFIGLDEVMQERLCPQPRLEAPHIGFMSEDKRPVEAEVQNGSIDMRSLLPTTEDLINYGFIPELVGRIPLRCRYNELSEEALCRILNNSAISPVRDFQRLFGANGNRLVFTGDALRDVAGKAFSMHTGARALRSVIAQIVYPIFYDLSDMTGMRVLITSETVNYGCPPVVTVYNEGEGGKEYWKVDDLEADRETVAEKNKSEKSAPAWHPWN